jgi:hypothetical protein
VFKRTCLFRFDDPEHCRIVMQLAVQNQIREAIGNASVQLYERVPRKNALPAALRTLLR